MKESQGRAGAPLAGNSTLCCGCTALHARHQRCPARAAALNACQVSPAIADSDDNPPGGAGFNSRRPACRGRGSRPP